VFITPHRLEGLYGWAEFLYRRLTRIFPPYWIVSCLLLVVWLHNPLLFNNFYHHQMDVGRSFLLLPQSFLPLVGVGWSLIHEVYFYLIISGLLIWGIAARISLLVLWFAAVLAANLLGFTEKVQGNHVLELILSPYGLEFQLGMLVAFFYRKLDVLTLSAWAYAFLAMGAIVAIYVAGQFIPNVGVYPNNNHLFRVGYYGLAAFVVVLSVVRLNASPSHIKAPGWCVLLGDASYAFYLMHVPIIDSLYKIFRSMTPHPSLALAFCYVAIIIMVTVGASVLFHILLERRLIRFFHKWATKHIRKPTALSKS
jgi:exopolysaccharide production protein ExoZ